MNKSTLNSIEQNRYSRHISLPEIQNEGQLKLKQSHAIIFGLGGLGSPASIYLAASGIGKITLVDFDQVDESNLQRQIIHNEANISQNKVDSAKQHLNKLNRFIEIKTLTKFFANENEMIPLVSEADVAIDCTDNFNSRFMLNKVCHKVKVPLVSGAAIRWEGQVSTYDFRLNNSPCYQCLYKNEKSPDISCSQNGVVSPVVGIIGSIQATEAIKSILRLPTLNGSLMIIDAYTMMTKTLRLKPDPKCPVCSKNI